MERKTWDEFSKTGLLWWINRTLHLFGWAIVFQHDNNKIVEVYPAKVNYRGFSEGSETVGFTRLTNYLKDNIE